MNLILFRKICIIYELLIIALLIGLSKNYIILPFNSMNLNLNLDEHLNAFNQVESLLLELSKNQIYTKLPIGNPPKNVDFYFTMDSTIYGILSGYCPEGSYSSYNPYLSQNLKMKSGYFISIGPINNAAIVEDNCTIYNNLNLTRKREIELEFLLGNYSSFLYSNRDNNKYCGRIGLYKSTVRTYSYAKNFIKYLNKEKIVDSYSWGIFFFDKENSFNVDDSILKQYNGFYIAGITSKDYFDIFKTTNILNTHTIDNNINLKIFFFEFENNNNEIVCSDNSLAYFLLDYNYIISGKEYYDNIQRIYFQKYIEDKICEEKVSYKTYEGRTIMIICSLTFKKYLNSFPTLYLHSRELSFTFNLDYNDLFLESNDKIYFLIVYKEMLKPVWKLGKIFMRKYPFIFDQDKKTISFVYLNKFLEQKGVTEKNYLKTFKDFCLYSLLFVGIFIGLFIGRRLWNKHRKLKANELEDNFDYTSHNKNTKIIE